MSVRLSRKALLRFSKRVSIVVVARQSLTGVVLCSSNFRLQFNENGPAAAGRNQAQGIVTAATTICIRHESEASFRADVIHAI